MNHQRRDIHTRPHNADRLFNCPDRFTYAQDRGYFPYRQDHAPDFLHRPDRGHSFVYGQSDGRGMHGGNRYDHRNDLFEGNAGYNQVMRGYENNDRFHIGGYGQPFDYRNHHNYDHYGEQLVQRSFTEYEPSNASHIGPVGHSQDPFDRMYDFSSCRSTTEQSQGHGQRRAPPQHNEVALTGHL